MILNSFGSVMNGMAGNDLFGAVPDAPASDGGFDHERDVDGKDEWLTPPDIVRALGPFDLDPCAPINRPWPTATKHYTIADNGLLQPWHGRVWLNPPYGTQTIRWLRRMVAHGNGIALTFARTETRLFFECVWPRASAVLFVKGRLSFWHADGKMGGAAGAPSVLIAYGSENALRLQNCGVDGKCIFL